MGYLVGDGDLFRVSGVRWGTLRVMGTWLKCLGGGGVLGGGGEVGYLACDGDLAQCLGGGGVLGGGGEVGYLAGDGDLAQCLGGSHGLSLSGLTQSVVLLGLLQDQLSVHRERRLQK